MKKITTLPLYSLLLWSLSTQIGASFAQVIPDSSLAGDPSIVIPSTLTDGSQGDLVIGGARRGSNLFHSFETFSIANEQALYFLESEGVARIFARVTGLSLSDIQGTLGVVSTPDAQGVPGGLGTADLYLLNKNGIVFGPNAQLPTGGSFIASTADTIQFSDGTEFSSVTAQRTSPLTSTVPIGLGLQNTAAITVQNTGREVVDNIFLDELSPRTGLAVLPDQTIALIGGNVNLDGGILRTPGGDVEIGSVQDGTVSLSTSLDGLGFDYANVASFGDLNLSQLSFIEISGAPAGRVRFTGRDISLRDGSLVFARNIGEGTPGNIEVNASESFVIGPSDLSDELLSGFYSDNFGAVGSEILINAPQVSVLNGGQIFANNYNSGSSGDIFVNARDSIQVEGFNASSERLVSFITSNGFDSADSGSLTLNAGDVQVLNGAQVGTIAVDGSPGNVEVSADNILVEGSLPTLLKPSILGIATGGTGDSGQFSIETNTLQVLNGGAVGTISIGAGDAGNTSITANEFIEVSGSFPGAVNPSSIDSSVTAINPITRVFLQVRPSIDLGGRAGSISIKTPQLFVQDSGAIRVQNDGPGDAGNLNVEAGRIQIRSDGQVVATTSGGDGGSVNIAADSLLLADQAAISATAVEEGRGGNVTVDSEAIALLDGSSISANAELGSGGQVTITTDALLQSPNSAITATSEAGPALDGSVEITVQEESLRTEEQVSPPLNTPSPVVACTRASEEGFAFVGRGGLPLSSETLGRSWEGWNTPSGTASLSEANQDGQIIEAQGFLPNGDGTVRFVDQATLTDAITAAGVTCVGKPPA